MSKIFIVMGKSAAGKDTIYKGLVENETLHLKTVLSYTTRPIRMGEKNGVEYIFVDDNKLEELLKEKKVIEHRAYQTVHGIWNYFTVNDSQIILSESNYIMIGTLESYTQIKEYYGADKVCPIYVELNDGIRLKRALKREEKQREPRYAEMCRRFLADEEDFSEEKIKEQGITKRYDNVDINICLQQIIEDILEVCYNY